MQATVATGVSPLCFGISRAVWKRRTGLSRFSPISTLLHHHPHPPYYRHRYLQHIPSRHSFHLAPAKGLGASYSEEGHRARSRRTRHPPLPRRAPPVLAKGKGSTRYKSCPFKGVLVRAYFNEQGCAGLRHRRKSAREEHIQKAVISYFGHSTRPLFTPPIVASA